MRKSSVLLVVSWPAPNSSKQMERREEILWEMETFIYSSTYVKYGFWPVSICSKNLSTRQSSEDSPVFFSLLLKILWLIWPSKNWNCCCIAASNLANAEENGGKCRSPGIVRTIRHKRPEEIKAELSSEDRIRQNWPRCSFRRSLSMKQ